MLTVAIPTYNRNEMLKSTVVKILSILPSDVRLVIIDNCSDIPADHTLKDVIDLKGNVNVIRNEVNVGLSGNVIKCFEYVKTGWLWVLPDDDDPMDNCIDVILKGIVTFPDAVALNYYCEEWVNRRSDFEATGVLQLINRIDDIVNFIFFTNNIYNIDACKKYLRFGFLFAHTLCPHTAVSLMATAEGGKYVFLKKQLVRQGSPDTANQWSRLYISHNIMCLLDLPLQLDQRTFVRFAKLLLGHTIRSQRVLFFNLIIQVEFAKIAPFQAVYLFDLIYNRQKWAKGHFGNFLSFYFYRSILAVGPLLYSCTRIYKYFRPASFASAYSLFNRI